jgi:hypothetical protein
VAVTQSGSGQTPVTGAGQDLIFTTGSTGTLALTSSKLRVRGGFVSVPLNCRSSLACDGRFSITTQATIGKRKLGTVLCNTTLFQIKPRKLAKVNARVYGACISLLQRAARHSIKAQFTSRPRSSQFGTIVNITLTL